MSLGVFMSFDSVLHNGNLFWFLKTALTVGGLWLATIFLIPRGIVFYVKWKKDAHLKHLSSAVSYVSGGIFILLYFLAIFIIDAWRR
jgi:hypothetical protein